MSSEQHNTFSPQNLSLLGGLLLIALILGEVVFPRQANDGMSIDSKGPGTMEDIAMRLKPVVTLDHILANAGSSGSSDMAAMSPEQLYQGACQACHASGVAGAPKVGDSAAWKSRLANGIDSLVTSAINGKGAMPPNGGSTYSEDQIRSVIEYILGESSL
ncbi:MAG: cytochrome c5 family protein [Gammaproteobacteria bacterium]|nr:MAG: cytochrome c5 family protein [Gammaproteobacteria bacterium]